MSKSSKPSVSWYVVYMLQCAGGSIYTGYTTDMEQRYLAHVNGTASKFTRAFPPEKILACWRVADNQRLAMQLECAIKRLSAKEKRELVSDPEQIQQLLPDDCPDDSVVEVLTDVLQSSVNKGK